MSSPGGSVGFLDSFLLSLPVMALKKPSLQAWSVSDSRVFDEIVPEALDRVTDALVSLLAAWKNISQEKLDEMIDKSVDTVGNIERGIFVTYPNLRSYILCYCYCTLHNL